MTRILALLALLLFLPGPSVAEPHEVEVTATGQTSHDAITQGLVQALEQISGVVIVSDQTARTELSSQVIGDNTTAKLTQQQQSETRKLTGGIVSGYRVLSTDDRIPVTVRLVVTIEVFEPKGLGNETRRRIAVATFATSGMRSGSAAELLRDRISAHLVQARRFAVLDRSQDEAYTREMTLLQSGNTPLAERARVGQVIGADYVVTGKLRQTEATSSTHMIGITGEVVTDSTAGSAEADFQVIEIATRQIKWAGTARISGDGAIDQISAMIADEITQTIYPMRLIKFDDPTNLIINQGGDSLHVGQRFRALLLGEMLADPYTHEALGQSEQEVGTVEISRVDAKVSYAKFISGGLPAPRGDEVQIVLRPPLPAKTSVHARPPGAKQDVPSITKLPFDP